MFRKKHITSTLCTIGCIAWLFFAGNGKQAPPVPFGYESSSVQETQARHQSHMKHSLCTYHFVARPTDHRTNSHHPSSFAAHIASADVEAGKAFLPLTRAPTVTRGVPALLYTRKIIFPHHWFG